MQEHAPRPSWTGCVGDRALTEQQTWTQYRIPRLEEQRGSAAERTLLGSAAMANDAHANRRLERSLEAPGGLIVVLYHANRSPLRASVRDHLYSFDRYAERDCVYVN